MENTKILDALKSAILLEKRGYEFYKAVSEKSNVPDVKKFFSLMAYEEDEHVKFLTKQYELYSNGKSFNPGSENEIPDNDSESEILIERIKDQITAASFEAAAIASAIDMETRAIKVYTDRSNDATDKNEKDFYRWLAKWESGHHKYLIEMDTALKEKIWNDNKFWPF